MSEQVNARRATGWAIVNVIVVLYALIPVLWILSLSLKPTSSVKDGKFNGDPYIGSLADKGTGLSDFHTFDLSAPTRSARERTVPAASVV